MDQAKHSLKDFAGIRYNVLDIGEEKVIDAFPDLQRFPELNQDFKAITKLDSEKVIKYVMLMYMENILRRSTPDLLKRKKEAALLAGFEISLKTRRFPVNLEKIFKFEIPEVNKLIVRVIRMNNSNAFEQLSVFEEARSRQMSKLLSTETEGEKTKEIAENIRKMSNDIARLQKELLVGEKSKDLIDSLYYEIDNITLGIRPEEIAEAKRAGALDKVLVKPYDESAPEMVNYDAFSKKLRRRSKLKA